MVHIDQTLAHRLLQLESESAIRRLVSEYCHGADKRDLERFAAVWSADAIWQVSDEQSFVGRDAILNAVRWQWGAFRRMQHLTANLVVAIDGDTASGVADVSVVTQLADGTWRRGGGVYRDEYRRTQGVWRIARRRADHLFDLAESSGLARGEGA